MTSMTVNGQVPGHGDERADVELKVPADSAYVSVLRTTTAGLAARLDFTIDDIEDLRIAVGEACAMVLPEAAPDADLWCRFGLGDGVMVVRVSVDTAGQPAVDEDSFAWQVLATLASEASAEATAGSLEVRLVMRTEVASGAGSTR
ncbi:anti-sigma factor [Nocardioides perillae]|uniref:Serine/threonine-protein kinase RsbW n=1 Tax=Nocardioides perillae TaxID=1119534 RepID=A0A7Y9UMG7_9ACTN|nr:anti-sigma factor [Nocardioides perillae]NYG55406.1 serine/threonine-protein kinase RsbW [Nocardioides perillae]